MKIYPFGQPQNLAFSFLFFSFLNPRAGSIPTCPRGFFSPFIFVQSIGREENPTGIILRRVFLLENIEKNLFLKVYRIKTFLCRVKAQKSTESEDEQAYNARDNGWEKRIVVQIFKPRYMVERFS